MIADLLYAGDRILIGALISMAVIGGLGVTAAGFAIYGTVRAIRRRRQVRRTLRQLEAHANHPAFNRLRQAIEEARKEEQ